jgi:methyl-accepting chemotaxis protein
MESLVNKLSIKTKILILILLPLIGFVYMSILYFSKVQVSGIIELIIPAIMFFLTILFSYSIQKTILESISKIKNGMEGFFTYLTSTNKDLELIDLDSEDDLGQMAKDLNSNIVKIKDGLAQDNEVINEAKFVSNMVGNGFLVYRINSSANNQYINELRDTVNDMIASLRINIVESFQTSLQYANRDFTKQAKKTDVGAIVNTQLRCLNMIGANISEFLAMVNKNGQLLDTKSSELLEYVNTLHTSTLTQASSVEQTVVAIDEITKSIADTTQKANNMLQIANQTKSFANEGIGLVSNSQQSMVEISESTNAINEAITIIDQIAFQTNILSLNAAVEAATAGEAGKGFAVVAQEVRNLASRSAEAAKEIKDLVENANNKAKDGALISKKMYESFNELNTTIEQNTILINDVANANKNQMESLTHINEAMESLDSITYKNTNIAKETKNVATQTNDVAQSMIQAVNNNEYNSGVEKRISNFEFAQELNTLKIDFTKLKQSVLNQVNSNSMNISLENENKQNIDKFISENQSNQFTSSLQWKEFMNYYEVLKKELVVYGEGMKERDDKKTLNASHIIEELLDKIIIMLNEFKENKK